MGACYAIRKVSQAFVRCTAERGSSSNEFVSPGLGTCSFGDREVIPVDLLALG